MGYDETNPAVEAILRGLDSEATAALCGKIAVLTKEHEPETLKRLLAYLICCKAEVVVLKKEAETTDLIEDLELFSAALDELVISTALWNDIENSI